MIRQGAPTIGLLPVFRQFPQHLYGFLDQFVTPSKTFNAAEVIRDIEEDRR